MSVLIGTGVAGKGKGLARPSYAFVARTAERFGLIVVWLLLIALFGALRPETFFTWPNFSTILGSQAVLVIVTLGVILSLTANDFDLSIANTLSLSSITVAILNVNHGAPLIVAVGAAVAIGAVVGLVNGFFIIVFRIHSLIVTLGVGTFLHGIGLWASDSQTISGIDPILSEFVIVRRLFGIPLVFYYAILLAAVVWYVFEFTAVGRRILFVGRGREVARLSGIHTDRLRWLCLIASGLFGSLAGVFYAGTQGAADPVSGDSYLLPALAAAFLGSTSILPGRFNPWGSTVAVYFLVTGITGLIFLGFGSFIQDMFYGGALVLAVALSQIARGRQEQSF
jgi:ribose transport system permease protein